MRLSGVAWVSIEGLNYQNWKFRAVNHRTVNQNGLKWENADE